MALNCVFSNELQFASSCELTETDEREKETDDLEEGEIEDDDEQLVEEKPVGSEPPSKDQNEAGSKDDVTRHQADASDNKLSGGEKQRDKRQTSNNLSGGNNNAARSKRRAGSHESSGREAQRKRRKTHESDSYQHGEGIGALPEGRGVSPSRPFHRSGESAGSDGEDNQVSTSPRRAARNTHDRRSRTNRGSPGRRRNNRGNSRERNSDRRRDRSDRDRRPSKPSGPPASRIKDESICAFFMEGKCSRGSDCPYSHAALPPRKMELCKFYLMDCCAKKEKCLYLHKDFPCKFFHTGKKCRNTAESCKFSHEALSETMRAILIKHIETAPREILGDFPRLTREETIQAIDNFSNPVTQQEKRPGIPALFEPASSKVNNQDINRDTKDSNIPLGPELLNQNSPRSSNRPSFYEEVAIGHGTEESKDAKLNEENSRSIWFGKLRNDLSSDVANKSDTESGKPDTLLSPRYDEDFRQPPVHLSNLPARQRLLYRRIQQQQREPLAATQDIPIDKDERTVNETWYSSDEEEEVDKSLAYLANSIHGEGGALPRRDADLNVSQEMNVIDTAKVLSSYQPLQKTSGQADLMGSMGPAEATSKRDPRMRDPRKRSADNSTSDVDLRTFVQVNSRLDVDLRFENKLTMDCDFRNPYTNRLGPEDVKRADVGFRGIDSPSGSQTMMQRHAFQEIDASTSNNPPIRYHLYPIDVGPVDYGVIKVHADWTHLDPRQQKNWASNRNLSASESSNSTLYSPASPEPPTGTSATPVGRSYETSYSPGSTLQTMHSDPRHRDPRSTGIPMESRGPAFPVIPQLHASESDTFSPTYTHHQRSYPLPEHSLDVPRDLHRPVENRRDPRQRFRNQT